MITVYAIKSEKDGRIYVGQTENFDKRFKEHTSGKTRSTKPYLPWKVLYLEEVNNRQITREREKYFKTGVGKEYLKNLRPRSSMDRIEVS
ncbi:MAG: GIY-YIG nuclease family protein [Cytophagaceae bacterium]